MTATATPAFPRQLVGNWTLLSSMIHGGDEILGTTRLFRTKGIVVNGRKIRIPVVSGNAIRGIWRRKCAFAFLDAYLAAGGEPISLSAFYYLTSGGSLKKGSDAGALDLGGERALRTLIPHAGLFGGAALGRIQPGKLFVDEAMPICRETLPLLRMIDPTVEEAETAAMSIRELREFHGYSRQDDAKNEHLHKYLTPAAVEEATAIIRRSESDTAAAAGVAQQMRYESEELVAGTVLFHSWGFDDDPNHDELVGIGAGLLRWAERPSVGGRNAVGHGNLLPRYRGMNPEVKMITDGTEPMEVFRRQTPEEAIRDHVTGHLDAITSLLRAL